MKKRLDTIYIRIKENLSSFNWVLFGNIMIALSQWLIIILLTSSNNAQDLGNYSFSLAIVSPLFMFFSLDLRRVLATSTVSKENFLRYLLNRLIHSLLAILALLIIISIFSYSKELKLTIMLIGTMKFIEYQSDIIFGYFQQKHKSELIGKSQLTRAIIITITFLSVYYSFENLILSLIILNVFLIFRLFFYDYKKSNLTIPDIFNFINTKPLHFRVTFTTNIALGMSLFIDSMIVNIPRYYLEYFEGIESVGYFSAIYYILVAVNFIIVPITTLIAPNLNEKLQISSNEFKRYINKILIYILIFTLSIVIFIWITSEYILKILYGQEFLVYNLEFKIISLSIVFSFMNGIMSLGLITIKLNNRLLLVNVFNLLVTTLFGYLLISNYQMLGASLIIVISRLNTFIYMYYIIFKNKVRR